MVPQIVTQPNATAKSELKFIEITSPSTLKTNSMRPFSPHQRTGNHPSSQIYSRASKACQEQRLNKYSKGWATSQLRDLVTDFEKRVYSPLALNSDIQAAVRIPTAHAATGTE